MFIAASLGQLVSNLHESHFNNVRRYYPKDRINLPLRKGVYPYVYMDSSGRLKETQLPPKEAFYSDLNDEHIPDEDYTHAHRVWKAFNCKNMRNYHVLYNDLDVLLLADVCIKNYNLDPAHYYKTPGLSWDAMVKVTNVELELLSDMDMLLMVEKGIRGGVSMISNRYGKANNEYMFESHDASKKSTFITYLDVNNLYGYGISMPLPTHGFKWVESDELENLRNHSYIMVDLEYPERLHDRHNDYPLAPELLELDTVEKLIPNLGDKEKYVVHYKNLTQYESLGLKIKKIHRGISLKKVGGSKNI